MRVQIDENREYLKRGPAWRFLAWIAVASAVQFLLLGLVFGSRLGDFATPVSFRWTEPPAANLNWRPDPAKSKFSNSLKVGASSPQAYTQVDMPLALTGTKLILSGKWFGTEDRLSYPDGYQTLEFPAPFELGNIGIVWLLGGISSDPVVVSNTFFFLTFFLVLWACMLALRWWRGDTGLLGVLAALAVANAPYHFMREPFFAANYMMIVPSLVGALLILGSKREVQRSKTYLFVVSALLPLFGLYWAAIGLFVLTIAIAAKLIASIWNRVHEGLGWYFRFLGATLLWYTLNLVLTLLPSLIRWSSPDSDGFQYTRTVSTVNSYAFRSVDLFSLPDYVPSWLGAFKRNGLLQPGEYLGEGVVYGGIIGLIASIVIFLVLAARLVSTPVSKPAISLPTGLAPLAWLYLGLLALVYYRGLGTLMNQYGMGIIKSWERAGFSLAALSVMTLFTISVTAWKSDWPHDSARVPSLKALAIGLSAIIGFQTIVSLPLSPDSHGHRAAAAQWKSMQDFYDEVEATSASQPILFFPPEIYPEGPSTCSMPVYASMLPYVFTQSLRWSSGAYKASYSAERQFAQAHIFGDLLIQRLVNDGYSGIVVDTRGLSAKQQARLLPLLDLRASRVIYSSDNILLYFEFNDDRLLAPIWRTADDQRQTRSDADYQYAQNLESCED